MNRGNTPSEKGQAIVLIVLAIVVLLGFVALAVDGSMVYADRRYAQSAADASSMAGASMAAKTLGDKNVHLGNWTATPPNCSGQVAVAAKAGRASAIQRAKANDFVIDQNITDNHGVVTECGIEPIIVTKATGGTVKIADDKYMDVRTLITNQTRTAFAHFVYSGPMVNTVTAVARIHASQPLAYGFAIVALDPNISNCNPNRPNGLDFHGLGGNDPASLEITGGVWSNGCLDNDGQVGITVHGALDYFGTGNNDTLNRITLDPGTIDKIADLPTNRLPADSYNINPPNCTGHEFSAADIKRTFESGGVTTFPPGLYCITTEWRINNTDHIIGDAVTLVLYDDLVVTGSPYLHLTAPTGNAEPAKAGLLIYAPPTNTCKIQINGDADSVFKGTLLAPACYVDFTGNMGLDFTGQIIGYDVAIGGSGSGSITFDNSNPIIGPIKIDMYR